MGEPRLEVRMILSCAVATSCFNLHVWISPDLGLCVGIFRSRNAIDHTAAKDISMSLASVISLTRLDLRLLNRPVPTAHDLIISMAFFHQHPIQNTSKHMSGILYWPNAASILHGHVPKHSHVLGHVDSANALESQGGTAIASSLSRLIYLKELNLR